MGYYQIYKFWKENTHKYLWKLQCNKAAYIFLWGSKWQKVIVVRFVFFHKFLFFLLIFTYSYYNLMHIRMQFHHF